ncbi:MAG: HupE/UreJ family protein [Byssovorax sp.]
MAKSEQPRAHPPSRGAKRAPRAAITGLAALSLLAAGATARAHEVGLSRGSYHLAEGVFEADLVFARRDAASLVAGLDDNGDGQLTAAEVKRSADSFRGAVAGRIKVRAGTAPCAALDVEAALTEEDGLRVQARYRCASPAPRVDIELALLEDLPFGHRHLAHLAGNDGPSDALLSQRDRRFALTADKASPSRAPAKPAAQPGAPATSAPAASAPSPWIEGAKRILRPDPLLFLLALALGAAAPRRVHAAFAVFTAAALLGAAIVLTGLWIPGGVVLGPALALSLLYAGADNRLREPTAHPAWFALPFGLSHGFALAVGTAAPPLPAAPAPLAAFLAGACAALALAAIVLRAAVLRLRARPSLAVALRCASWAIAGYGLVAFVLRVRTQLAR